MASPSFSTVTAAAGLPVPAGVRSWAWPAIGLDRSEIAIVKMTSDDERDVLACGAGVPGSRMSALSGEFQAVSSP